MSCIYFQDIPCISLDIHGISTRIHIYGISKDHDIPYIYHTYTIHMDEDTICMVYTIHIPGIYQNRGSRCTAKPPSRGRTYDIMTSGILYPWTGLGKMVRTGMYQYVTVQDGTGQYKNSQFVHTGMYQYILVRTFKKSSGFLTNPERVRRDEIRVIHRLCMGYNVTRSNFKTAQV